MYIYIAKNDTRTFRCEVELPCLLDCSETSQRKPPPILYKVYKATKFIRISAGTFDATHLWLRFPDIIFLFNLMFCVKLEGYCRIIFSLNMYAVSRPQWSRGLRRGSAAARLLGLWVRILPGPRISVSCECCVLSGGVPCEGLITRPEEPNRVFVCLCVIVRPR